MIKILTFCIIESPNTYKKSIVLYLSEEVIILELHNIVKISLEQEANE